MIGKTFTRTENKVIIRRKVLSEYFQYGRRFYMTEDPEIPGVEIQTLADDFDRIYKTSGKVSNRRTFNAKYRERK